MVAGKGSGSSGIYPVDGPLIFANIENVLAREHAFNVPPPFDTAEKMASDAVHDDGNLGARRLRLEHFVQCRSHLPEAGHGVDPRQHDGIGILEDWTGPGIPGDREVEHHQAVFRQDHFQQRVEGVRTDVTRVELVAWRGEYIKSGAMMADEEVEKLLVQALGPVDNIVKLQPRVDIEIVADMAGLEIEVDIADLSRPAGLGELDAQSDIERDGGVTDAAQGWQKGNDGWPPLGLNL